MWQARRKESGSKDFYHTAAFYAKCVDRDWSAITAKGRFLSGIKRRVKPERVDEEISATKEAISLLSRAARAERGQAPRRTVSPPPRRRAYSAL